MRKASAPGQLAVEINGTAAHAGHYAGIFHLLPVQPHQDDVALGPVHVVQHAKHFHFHGLRLHPFENRIGNATHAGMNLADGDDRRIWAGVRFLRSDNRREGQANNEES